MRRPCKERVATEPFTGPARTDVCVVGGGYAGLSTALHLARRGVDVTLLEQSLLGWGASGRNGGQAHVGMRREQEWLEEHLGLADARRLWEFSLGARAHLDWLIETYRIDCDLRLGYLHANHRERYTRGDAPPRRASARELRLRTHSIHRARRAGGDGRDAGTIAVAVLTRVPATCMR